MEKFSAFRDPGTGIHPFLTPVSPSGNELLRKALLPFGIVIGVARVLVVIAVGLPYFLLDSALSPLLVVPPIRIVKRLIATVFARLILFTLGFWWIPVEVVNKRRGRTQVDESWSPGAGDIIVSNWVSWVELLWLAFRFDPVFVLPVTEPLQLNSDTSSTPTVQKLGRRTGTGSAAISNSATFASKTRQPTPRAQVLGFKVVSIWYILAHTGRVPVRAFGDRERYESLEEVRKRALGPVVVFPECTTSNGRGLLRFADVFKHERNVPVKGYKIFLMCIRYDPPTTFVPSISHSIPSNMFNPSPHLFTLASTFSPLAASIRLLAPSESPSSATFVLSNVLPNGSEGADVVTEVSATLIAQVGKTKRTGLGWEDKASFLEFYGRK
ncbi:hypothetical protein BJ322DRAFT_1074087 [Thelephora terrestris]|uniref:Phospholipid/glycerol acyltransferase domain-containing protein n=1 Tax=Thelephora terrestris TaxID=56493 RepID=A0A9P6HAZ9_9AGAM|nr:hypothetical protein BJ322DRAFT_1074087 [Thelephora terrestris]